MMIMPCRRTRRHDAISDKIFIERYQYSRDIWRRWPAARFFSTAITTSLLIQHYSAAASIVSRDTRSRWRYFFFAPLRDATFDMSQPPYMFALHSVTVPEFLHMLGRGIRCRFAQARSPRYAMSICRYVMMFFCR
jgi:hypothetical protein